MKSRKSLTTEQKKSSDPRFERIRLLPKVSLHCHLEGAVRPHTLLALCEHHGITLEGVDPSDPEALFRFTDFIMFLRRFRDVCRSLVQPVDYGHIAREFVDDLLYHNVRYAEIFLSPAAWQRLHPELDLRLAMEEIARAFANARDRGLEVAVIVDLTRNFGPLEALETTALALRWRDLGVIGIGLGGDEAGFPAQLFTESFARARKAGLRCVAHAGEAAGPQSVRATVADLHVERIGHGIRAVEDPALLEELATRGIAFEQCPTSNRKTGVLAPGAEHPIADCVRAGLRVAVDSDDPALFQTSITQELVLLEERYGSAFIHARLADAIAVSFAQSSLRQKLESVLEDALCSISPNALAEQPTPE